jgi:hypothetical protein
MQKKEVTKLNNKMENKSNKIREYLPYAYMAMGAITGLVIFAAISQKSPEINIEKPKSAYSYEIKRTYSDTDGNQLYDTLNTKIYSDGKLKHDKTAKMGKECTASEIEKITADRAPSESIELK